MSAAAIPIVSAIAGSVASGFIGNMFSHPQKEPAVPDLGRMAPIPLPDDKAVQDAQRRSIALMQKGSGRASTILTDSADNVGNSGGDKLGV